MISNSRQKWQVGSTVKVGFMSLVVKAAISTPGDYNPDAYILSNAAGTQLYRFVPHKGVEKISVEQAQALLAEQAEYAARVARRAIAAAQEEARKAEAIGALFA